MLRFLKRLWVGWKEIAGCIGDFQSRLLLTVFYFTVALPFGLLVRIASDPLRVRRPPSPSGWMNRPPQKTDLPAAQRQF
jgi:hypothetical protein